MTHFTAWTQSSSTNLLFSLKTQESKTPSPDRETNIMLGYALGCILTITHVPHHQVQARLSHSPEQHFYMLESMKKVKWGKVSKERWEANWSIILLIFLWPTYIHLVFVQWSLETVSGQWRHLATHSTAGLRGRSHEKISLWKANEI